MNTKIPFQFTILRYVHDAFTGEFLNIGLAYYCQDPAFFRVRILQRYSRITAAFPSADGEFYRRYVLSLQGKMDRLADRVNSKQSSLEPWLPKRIEELLHQVLPPDDSAIQFGEVQGGMTSDVEGTFEELYKRMVEAYLSEEESESRNEEEVWSVFREPLKAQNVIRYLQPKTIHTKKQDFKFEFTWKNGHWNILQPLSFDLVKPKSIKNKALQYFGTNIILQESKDIGALYYLLGAPQRDDKEVRKEYKKAIDLLGSREYSDKIQLVPEDEAEEFAKDIAPKIQADTSHNQKK